jgi:two-component system, LytTR family, response regulator
MRTVSEFILLPNTTIHMLQLLHLRTTDYLSRPADKSSSTSIEPQSAQPILCNSDEKSIESLLDNLQKAASPAEMKLCIPTLKGFVVLKLEDIVVCEAEKNYTIIHLQNRKSITVSRSLVEYEKSLEGAGFLRVHRTYLINLQHVCEYHRGEGGIVIMSNGAEVEISRRRKDEFLSNIKGAFRY